MMKTVHKIFFRYTFLSEQLMLPKQWRSLSKGGEGEVPQKKHQTEQEKQHQQLLRFVFRADQKWRVRCGAVRCSFTPRARQTHTDRGP